MKKLALLAVLAMLTTADLLSSPAGASVGAWVPVQATVTVNGRADASTSAAIVYTYQGGQIVYINCWKPGTTINGDNIWYHTTPNPNSTTVPRSWVAGYYLTTGADPTSDVPHC